MKIRLNDFDISNKECLESLVLDMEKNPVKTIEGLNKLRVYYKTVLGIIAVIKDNPDDADQKIIKIVNFDSETGKWNKSDKGVFIKIPKQKENAFSADITELFIGDMVTAILCPEYEYTLETNELISSCIEIKEGAEWSYEDREKASLLTVSDEELEEFRREREQEEKKERKSRNLNRLQWVVILVGIIAYSLYLHYKTPEKEVQQAESNIVGSYLFADSDGRYFSEEEVAKMSLEERDMACYEILARHGVDFSNVGDGGVIQSYFAAQEWYEAKIDFAEFDYTVLNVYEAANLAMLIDYESMKETEVYHEKGTIAENDEVKSGLLAGSYIGVATEVTLSIELDTDAGSTIEAIAFLNDGTGYVQSLPIIYENNEYLLLSEMGEIAGSIEVVDERTIYFEIWGDEYEFIIDEIYSANKSEEAFANVKEWMFDYPYYSTGNGYQYTMNISKENSGYSLVIKSGGVIKYKGVSKEEYTQDGVYQINFASNQSVDLTVIWVPELQDYELEVYDLGDKSLTDLYTAGVQ